MRASRLPAAWGVACALLIVGTAGAQTKPAAPAVKPPANAVIIESTYWRLARLGDDKVSFPASPREPHLIFEAGGRVSGADGCNTLRGLYDLSGTNIKIGPLVATRMVCEDAKGLDARFREAVGAATTVKVSPTTLDLLDPTGTVLASFTARSN